MIVYENNLKREFNTMLRERKQHTDKRFPLEDLLVPTFTSLVTPNEDRKLAIVKGVTEPYFEQLNLNTVELLGRVKLYKRETLSDGGIRYDKDGKEVKKEIPVPNTSIAFLSPINIKLPNYVDVNGEQKKVKISDGYKYVDYIEKDGNRKYIYIIPKEFVYILDLNALVITPNKRRHYYSGYKFMMQDGNPIYIYVIPYKLRSYTEVRILGVKPSCDFTKEVQQLVNTWIDNKIVFNPTLTSLDTGVNMGYQDEGHTLYADDYIPYTLSVKEEKELEY